MKKMVLKVTIEDEKSKRKAFKVVAGVEGVDSVAVDMKEKKITVIGDADPVNVTAKLRKSGFGFADLLSVGPAKEEKKEEKKDKRKEETKVESPKIVFIEKPYGYGFGGEENPNACGCTIC
ncbi:hypothetical protein SUGI_0124130 [Cryptomeria japonica]|uniref:heavy metal-associated isoprenylated plant protein 39 n=1 Tax=Cryptomeria japonica TaxID=3369 RepID=UPI002408C570|nr:heavy metal-associated isoprenylated plant protein 39 [Cryptomeria japonica]GLJ10211.1 hypothetical protein SUGI_0124130 [Cryptomeria japonica]